MAVDVVIGYLKPRRALLVGVGVEATPTDDSRVELALVEEKSACCFVEEGTVEEPEVLAGVECVLGRLGFVGRLPL